MNHNSQEHFRLQQHRERKANWRLWGPYLSERAWGTVREDYSENNDTWNFFPHDHARSRAYRWNEDGLSGISDRNQLLCFAPSFWNGKDPILKERYFGLSNEEGNHGEDVKEYYFYLDNLPTHSYMKMLYKYPQQAYPYQRLIDENKKRNLTESEFELLDTQIFDEYQYFDIFVEYAKVEQDDLIIQITAFNRSSHSADLHIIPNLWFRNTWSWNKSSPSALPSIKEIQNNTNELFLCATSFHPVLGDYHFYAENASELIFTNNETNLQKLFDQPNTSFYVKDAFHHYLIDQNKTVVNPLKEGTKAGALYFKNVAANESWKIRLRLSKSKLDSPFKIFDNILKLKQQEADEFYQTLQNSDTSSEEIEIQRQAFAGLLWSKQFYHLDLAKWQKGDDNPLTHRKKPSIVNKGWGHLFNYDIISMPDKWEFPWYASWDLAFHCVSLVMIDPDFAKRQMLLMTREWYMHPNGQLPAYEWNFGDASPPVLAWSAWRIYKIDAHMNGTLDKKFLSRIYHKLLINFTWWINRKDIAGRNVFEGGFLGLDNISIFNRSEPLPSGGIIYQSDATAWMAFYCIIMLKIAMELSRDQTIYEDLATKFFEHYLRISQAMVNCGGQKHSLWDEEDGFFYDVVALPEGTMKHLKVRSLVGLLPLLAVETANKEYITDHSGFAERAHWFYNHYPEFQSPWLLAEKDGLGDKRIFTIVDKDKLTRILHYMLDENEFLSDYGIRSLSKYHENHPYEMNVEGKTYSIRYESGESQSRLFGGNSNWRGPIWFPLNFLIIESLQKFHYYYGETFKVECPTGSGNFMTLWEVATELSRRLISLYLPDDEGKRPVFGQRDRFSKDPDWTNKLLFHEYFHGDTGAGLGASHQTGWTALIAKLIQQSGRSSVRDWEQVSKTFKTKL